MFRENNVEYERIDYFIEPLSEEKLRELLAKMRLSAFDVLRKAEKIYKELNLSKETDSDKVIKIIAENPALLQRPIVEVGDKAVLARPIEKALELIRSEK